MNEEYKKKKQQQRINTHNTPQRTKGIQMYKYTERNYTFLISQFKNFTLAQSYNQTQVTKRAQQHTRCI